MSYTIQTSRLQLKTPALEDVPRLFELMSDKNLTKFLSWEPHKNIETTEIVIKSLIEAQKNDRGYHWCVHFNNQIIGLVSLIDVKRTIRTWTLNRAELSYWITSDFQGKGFATESSKGVIDFGFDNLRFHKIIVAHAAENVESRSICTKLKFNQYAHASDAFLKEGKWHDLIWYELIKDKE